MFDMVPGQKTVEQRIFLFWKGLNVPYKADGLPHDHIMSSFPDVLIIYGDADESLLKSWYVDLSAVSQRHALPSCYFHHYAALTEAESVSIASHIWDMNYRLSESNILLP